jgi:signal transduction histidine kinase
LKLILHYIITILLLCTLQVQAQHIFMPNDTRIVLIDSLHQQMKKLSVQKHSFQRDTSLFYTIDEYHYHYFEINRPFSEKQKMMEALPDSMYRIALRNHWVKGEVISLYKKGNAVAWLGDKAGAVKYYEKALDICKRNHFPHEESKTLVSLAVCFAYRKNISKQEWNRAMDYMNQAFKIANANQDLENIHHYYNLMGDYLVIRKDYKKALFYYEAEHPMLLKHPQMIGFRTNLAYLGICYLNTNQEVLAWKYLNQFFLINKNNEGSYASYLYHTVLSEIGNYYLKSKKDFKNALKYQLKYEQIVAERTRFDATNHYEAMMQIYAGLKDFPKAFAYQQKYLIARDSLKLEENSRKFTQYENQLINQRKENNIKSLKNEILENENSAQKSKILNMIILFVMITILLIVISYAYWLKHKKAQTELALSEEREQTENQVIKAQETERNRIAQDLHDEVGNALAALKNFVVNTNPDLSNKINKIAQEVRDISHNLASIDFDKTTLSTAFQNIIYRQNEAQTIVYELIEIGIPQKMPPDKSLVIYRIACELLNNIQKHSKAKNATVQLIYEPDTLTLMVEDDGIGIQTNGKKGEGIGLNHIKTRVAYLNGKLTIDDDGKGTVIIINIPL